MAGQTRHDPSPISFAGEVLELEGSLVLLVPEPASTRLPSRGQVAVRGTITGHDFDAVVEPDGRRGHWIKIDHPLRQATGLSAGDTAEVTFEVAEEWPEPEVPPALATALDDAPRKVQQLWEDITPMARWEWVRWVGATKNSATRERRVDVSISKLDSGKRRPCCFDLAACTDPELSRSGKLVQPSS
ncbi:YdeI/OmpD-associated family protein [soil metagenome]